MKEPRFLLMEEVLGIHAHQIETYGGSFGVRDAGSLLSAVAAPQASFAGELFHATVFEMAAAYLFHLARNHPFIDGNKRAALASALVFLELNDVSIEAPDQELIEMVLRVATGKESKSGAAVFLERFRTPGQGS
ncbi:MAG: type II toxin-antitoxin system death-on-curing family toxin [Deltaproteobacteria bacterium]|nr:MAG: type II toxin-antitoxin system death-on-curing family toxin [Deltaproteobacteria bacterium]